MANPLSTEQAKAALGDVARGRPSKSRDLTSDEAKRRLRDTASEPSLRGLARTRPLLAVTMALGYGFMLGSDRVRADKFLALMGHSLNIPVQKRAGT